MNRAISGTGKVLKQGTGDVTISGAQSYAVLETTGGTTTLTTTLTTSLANATINNTSGTLNLNANATLGAPGMAQAPEFDGGFAENIVQAVPEPGSIGLLLSGFATAFGRRRRRG